MSVYVLLYRPEAELGDGPSRKDPFDGIEIFSVFETNDEAMEAIDLHEFENPKHSEWKWHVVEVADGA